MMNLLEYLKIQTTSVTPNKVILHLDVEAIHHQPYGVLHGGMNGVLIETACSIGANANLTDSYAVGVDLQVSHFSSVSHGTLEIIATPEKIGGRLQFWQAEIWSADKKIASGKCTLMINQLKTEPK